MTLRFWTAFWIISASMANPVLRPAAGQSPEPGLKSETTALMWSLLGTVLPAGAMILASSAESNNPAPGLLFLGAVLVGPSLGHFYANRSGRALAGMGIRTLAMVGLVGGFAAAWNNNSGGDELMVAGLVLWGTTLAWDIIAAPHSARVHNAKIRRHRVAIGLGPTIEAPGVQLSIRIPF